MKPSGVLAALALLVAALPLNLHATLLLADSKFPAPGDCSQKFLGIHDDRAGDTSAPSPIPVALDDIDGRWPVTMGDPAAAWAMRAHQLKSAVSPSDWQHLAGTWDRYAAARGDTERALDRLCTGGELARSFGFDIAYVVLAPFEILGAFSPDEKGEARLGLMMLPVGGAIALAADAVVTVISPAMKLKARRRTRRAALALKTFTDLVVELEGVSKTGQGKT